MVPRPSMLLFSFGEVDWLARDKGQFAIDDARTDGAGNRGEHGRKVYTKAFPMPQRPVAALA